MHDTQSSGFQTNASLAFPAGKLESIQIMRGLAALLVVFHHMCWAVDKNSTGASFFNTFAHLNEWGAAGVDIFFVISGFIMFYITGRAVGAENRPGEFLLRRVFRIYPIYLFYTGVLLALHFAGLALKTHSYSASYLLTSATLFPMWSDHGSGGIGHPALDQGWTLSYEMYFYFALAGALLVAGQKNKIGALVAIFLAAAAITSILPASGLRNLATSPLILEFLLGMAAAWIRFRYWGLLKPYAIRIFVLGFALLAATIFVKIPEIFRVPLWGIPAFFMIAGASAIDPKNVRATRIMVFLGDASYSIYCSHALFAMLAGGLLKRGYLHGIAPDAIIVGMTTVALMLGALGYLAIEKPLHENSKVLVRRWCGRSRGSGGNSNRQDDDRHLVEVK